LERVIADPVACRETTGAPMVRVRLSPANMVNSKNGNFVVDRESWTVIEPAFRNHGAALEIDLEHESLMEDLPPKDRLGTVGWIEDLEFKDGEGLFAKVQWNDEGRSRILSDRFRYISPVLIVRKADGKAIGLHSVGLTNRPAIVGMERIAAKDQTGISDLKSQNELAAGHRKDRAMNELLLIGKDLGLAEADCKVETITNKIGELKKRAETPPETAKAVLVANAARKALGLKEDADADMVAASIATEKAGTAGLKADGYVRGLLAVAVGTTLTGGDRFIDVAAHAVDNSAGADGAKKIKVHISGRLRSCRQRPDDRGRRSAGIRLGGRHADQGGPGQHLRGLGGALPHFRKRDDPDGRSQYGRSKPRVYSRQSGDHHHGGE
jgi:hypothetical protein